MNGWLKALAAAAVLSLSAACATSPAAQEAAIAAALDNPARTEADRARDAARHPAESLAFWGLEPGMAILEVQPGGGWWTRVLAPHARDTGGSYAATAADLADAQLSDRAREGRAAWEAEYVAPGALGPITLVNWGPRSAPLPAESYDFILVARAIHGWVNGGMLDKALSDLFAATAPGGILAIEQHRAKPGETDVAALARNGYVPEAFVIEAAERAGYVLAGRSELNANPADTRDHPFGVWTLPPVARTSPFGEPPNPDFDRTRYDAIGESDRMTLRFVRPA